MKKSHLALIVKNYRYICVFILTAHQMTRRLSIWIVTMLVALSSFGTTSDDVAQARALAQRLSPKLAAKVEFKKITADNGKDLFTLDGENGKVVIGGNNANSMATGLNRYLNRYCMTTVSWYADVPV